MSRWSRGKLTKNRQCSMNVVNSLLSLTKTPVCISVMYQKAFFNSQEPKLFSLSLHLWYEWFFVQICWMKRSDCYFQSSKNPQEIAKLCHQPFPWRDLRDACWIVVFRLPSLYIHWQLLHKDLWYVYFSIIPASFKSCFIAIMHTKRLIYRRYPGGVHVQFVNWTS